MAIVRTIERPGGCRIIIMDDAYRDASAEEIARRWRALSQAIAAVDAELRRKEASAS